MFGIQLAICLIWAFLCFDFLILVFGIDALALINQPEEMSLEFLYAVWAGIASNLNWVKFLEWCISFQTLVYMMLLISLSAWKGIIRRILVLDEKVDKSVRLMAISVARQNPQEATQVPPKSDINP